MSASPSYYQRIDETFEAVESRLEILESDPDIVTAEGVLNVTFANGVVFVFSRQPAVEQLWLATPGGGFHFIWDESGDHWVDTKSGREFVALLLSELSIYAKEQLEWE